MLILTNVANIIFYSWIVINGLLFIHVFHELILMFLSFGKRTKKSNDLNETALPMVTVQLPLYNEKFVVKRLLESVTKLEYPKDKLEIQILDDSTDETSDIIIEFITNLNPDSFHFIHIQREDRVAYKAGALAHGMETCKGEFIAIFDADFIPDPHFIKQTLGSFQDSEIGLVQTRWTYLNEDSSILTRAQSIMLNTHFGIEQLGRKNGGGFINFNGTAGIWRRKCIDQSGGWQGDTLTEDLDLSFRAQSKGWKFEYLFDVGSPSELPATFEAYRTQQFRWSKGAAECLRKNAGMLWKSDAKERSKIMGTFHLLNSSVYILVIAILLLSPAVFYFNQEGGIDVPYQEVFSAFGASVIYMLLLIFFVGNWRSSINKLKTSLLFIPSVLTYFAMSTGISLYMVFGVIEGYVGKKSAFVRTPKFGESEVKNIKKGYDFKKERSIMILEFICLLYGAFWSVIGLNFMNFMTLIYGLIILMGFSLSLFFKNRTFRWSS
jgi:cellulose synthase/poly-beta-1,6-N-acetylglucosamine synthase-like glycosyltransferase